MSTQLAPRRMTARRILRSTVSTLDSLLSPHGVDRYVELVNPVWSTNEVRARLVSFERVTKSSITLTLRPNGNWEGFEAGQHTQLTVEVDGVRHTRCYSMTNSSHDNSKTIELTVKRQEGGVVSNFLYTHARVGMVVGLAPAQGSFTLPRRRPAELLLISGGSGITPVISILRTLCQEGAAMPITFLHYALTEDEMVYGAALAEIEKVHSNVRVVRVFTDVPGSGDFDGFLTEKQLSAIQPSWRSTATYVCGPGPLMGVARNLFTDAGSLENLHSESFTLDSFAAAEGGPENFLGNAPEGKIRFALSNIEVSNDGRGILEQAEAAGLSPKSGCRMGICHTCPRRLRSGTVRNAVTGEVTSGKDVDIRICINVPQGNVEVDL